MFTSKNPATSDADLHATRPCHHTSATCWRPDATFKTAKGRVAHVAMHKAAKAAKAGTVKTTSAPAVKNTPTQEEDRELRGPAGKRAKRVRASRHADGQACMNVHTGTHAAYLLATSTPVDVVEQAETIVAETPAPVAADMPAWAEVLMLTVAQLAEVVGELAIATRTNA